MRLKHCVCPRRRHIICCQLTICTGLDPQTAGVFRDVTADTDIDLGSGKKLKVRRNERLLVSLAKANLDVSMPVSINVAYAELPDSQPFLDLTPRRLTSIATRVTTCSSDMVQRLYLETTLCSEYVEPTVEP